MLRIKIIGAEGRYSKVEEKRVPVRHWIVSLTDPQIMGLMDALAQYPALKKTDLDTLNIDLASDEWSYEKCLKEE